MSLYSEGQSPQTTAISEEKCQRDLNVLKCNDSDEKIANSLPLYMLSTVFILYLYVQYFCCILFCVNCYIHSSTPKKKKKNGQIGKKKKEGKIKFRLTMSFHTVHCCCRRVSHGLSLHQSRRATLATWIRHVAFVLKRPCDDRPGILNPIGTIHVSRLPSQHPLSPLASKKLVILSSLDPTVRSGSTIQRWKRNAEGVGKWVGGGGEVKKKKVKR